MLESGDFSSLRSAAVRKTLLAIAVFVVVSGAGLVVALPAGGGLPMPLRKRSTSCLWPIHRSTSYGRSSSTSSTRAAGMSRPRQHHPATA